MKDRVFELDHAVATWVGLSELPDRADAVVRGLTEQVTTYYLAHRDQVSRYVRYACRSNDPEEITQEAFLRLYVALERGERISNVTKWLFTVARNLVIDKSRSRGMRYVTPVLRQVWEKLADTVPSQQPSCESKLIDESRFTELQSAVGCLTELQRQCLYLRSEGLLYREIGEILDISVPSVADALQRAVCKLRHRLGDVRVPTD